MTPKLLDTGRQFIGRVLIGEVTPNYGIYVEYSNKAAVSVPDVDYQYFQQRAAGTYTGYARIPVLTSHLTDNGILFTGMLTSEDLQGGKLTKNTVLTTTTLVNLGAAEAEDTFLYTALLKQPVKVVTGTYITVSIRLLIGGRND